MEEQLLQLKGPSLNGVVAHVDASGIAVAELALGGKGMTVKRLAHMTVEELPEGLVLSEPESLAGALSAVLTSKGFPPRIACLGLDDSLTGVTLADLPGASPLALSALIGRRVRAELPAQTTDLIAHHAWLHGPPAAAGGKSPVADVLAPAYVAWVQRDFVVGLSQTLTKRGLTVERIMPSSLALLDLLGHVLPDEPGSINVSVRFCWPSIVMGIFINGRVANVRFLSNVMVGARGDMLEVGVTELRRTLSFVREKNRGRQPSRVTFCGLDSEQSRAFSRTVEEDIEIPADTLGVDWDLSSVPDQERLSQVVPTVVLAGLLHHAAGRGKGHDLPLDLSPPQPPRDRWLLAVALVALLVCGAYCSYLLLQAETQSEALALSLVELKAQQSQLALTQPSRSRELEQMRLNETWSRMLRGLAVEDTNPAEPALQTVMRLPATISLKSATLENSYPGPSHFSLSLQGDFTGPGSAVLRELEQDLEGQTWCDSVVLQRGALTLKQGLQQPAAKEDVSLEVQLR